MLGGLQKAKNVSLIILASFRVHDLAGAMLPQFRVFAVPLSTCFTFTFSIAKNSNRSEPSNSSINVIFTLAIEAVFDINKKPAKKNAAWFGLGATPNYQRQSMTRHLASTRREGGEP